MLDRPRTSVGVAGLTLALGIVTTVLGEAPPRPPAKPADIRMEVVPASVPPGGDVRVIVRVEPIAGVKINRYPKVELAVPASAGLVAGSTVSVGNDAAPPPEQLETNFFKDLSLELPLSVDAAASSGAHQVSGKLTYFYCLTGSFCTRKSVDLTIPLNVR
jgi:hypothetical protein